MENSIETIWKEGFLHEENLVVPRVNDLYNRKSIHLVDRLKRRLRFNLIMILVFAFLFPVMGYFMQVIWQGAAASVLLFLTAWYNKRQIDRIITLDQGATSFDYLRLFNRWLDDARSRSEKIFRFSYPLSFLIAVCMAWSTWHAQTGGELSFTAGIIAAMTTLMVFDF